VHYLPAAIAGLESRPNLLDIEVLHRSGHTWKRRNEKWGRGPMARVALEEDTTREMSIATDSRFSHSAGARRPSGRSPLRLSRGSSSAPTGADAKGCDGMSLGRSVVGYQVAGPEGPLGVVEAIRFEPGSAVPFLLVVRDDERMSLVPTKRVVQILRESHCLLLSPACARTGQTLTLTRSNHRRQQ
jgi:hypothetical protein